MFLRNSFLLAILALSTPASALYTLTDLGTFPGHTEGAGLAINNSGQVTGYSRDNSGHTQAFISDPNTNNLNILQATVGYAINNSGLVAGVSANRALICNAAQTVLITLKTLGSTSSIGYAINSSGQITGSAAFSFDDTQHAFITDALTPEIMSAGNFVQDKTDLGTLGGVESVGLGINDAGQVTGYSTTSDSLTHAFVTDGNTHAMVDLGTLGGSYSRGLGINNKGQITGQASITGDSEKHAFVTDINTHAMLDLGTLGGEASIGRSINNSGQVTGNSTLFDGTEHAFVTIENQMYDLNKLLVPGMGKNWVLLRGNGINDAGQITGLGTLNGINHAFLLSPVVNSLTVTPANNGVIYSNTGGITCGEICSSNYNSGAKVKLTAVPKPGYVFSGWTGDCTGVGA